VSGPTTRLRALAVALALLGGGATACASGTSNANVAPPGDRRLVMVSGRDDHGLLATKTVALYDRPASGHVIAEVPDGTLLRVTETDGTWQHVITAEGPAVGGWVDDYYLRGELRLVGQPPTCRSRIDGAPVPGGTLVTVWRIDGRRIQVRAVAGHQQAGWARRTDLQELAPQGPDCGEDPPDQPEHHPGP
jgi:hypothetical protein